MSRASVLAALAVVAVLMPLPAHASTFTVTPTQLFLHMKVTSTTLVIRNDSDAPILFQLSTWAWKQTPSGELLLTSTTDLIVFPLVFTVDPHKERRIRIGKTVAAAAIEQTYRLFVEELPPPPTSNPGGQIQMLTKIGVPIFIAPLQAKASAAIEGGTFAGGALAFALHNTGNVHIQPRLVHLASHAADGRTVSAADLSAWYVLAGDLRTYSVPLTDAMCQEATSLVVEVGVETSTLTKSFALDSTACR